MRPLYCIFKGFFKAGFPVNSHSDVKNAETHILLQPVDRVPDGAD